MLATGVVDRLPDIDGLKSLYGRSVFHCPYCDGWELRDQPIAIYGLADRHTCQPPGLDRSSYALVGLKKEPETISADDADHLAAPNIAVPEVRISRVEASD